MGGTWDTVMDRCRCKKILFFEEGFITCRISDCSSQGSCLEKGQKFDTKQVTESGFPSRKIYNKYERAKQKLMGLNMSHR